LKAALGAIASGLAPAVAQAQGPQTPAENAAAAPAAFTREMVVDLARALAAKPYAATKNDLREPFASLSYEQFVGIKTKPGAALWSGENKGFSIEPLHRGNIFTTLVDLYVIENGAATKIPYDSNRFDYGGLKLPEKLPDLGYSGFRVLHAQPGISASPRAASPFAPPTRAGRSSPPSAASGSRSRLPGTMCW